MLKCSRRLLQSISHQPRFSIPTFAPLRQRFKFVAMDSEQPRGQDRKRPSQGGRGSKRQKTRKEKPATEGGHEEVLLADVRALFAVQKLSTPAINSAESLPAAADANTTEIEIPAENGESEGAVAGAEDQPLPAPFTEIEVKVLELSSTGDGLAKQDGSNQIYVVPFTSPGDVVKIKVIRRFEREHYSICDFVSVVTPGPFRDDSRINCKYFSKCSGCQFQMMDYDAQLAHKRTIVEKAYKNFSQLPPGLVPVIENTIGSPLQYGYRTKLTPHFDGPPGHNTRAAKREGVRPQFKEVPNIGFMLKGQRKTLDIEDCPIGTDAVNMGMKRERLNVAKNLEKYRKGVTILLRESTERVPKDDKKAVDLPEDTIKVEGTNYTDFKTCITDNNAKSTEYIDDFVFTNTAGAFFQNNNSILPVFTQYIRDQILPPANPNAPAIKYFIDAYSGSGLFTITLSSLFTKSVGIDIAESSIISARENAALNKLPPSQCTFIAADAPQLFKSVEYPNDETVVILDPPRKGCDESFLNQLLKFAPRRVVYVSCNVHTQARDVGVLVRGISSVKTRYEIETLRGFDFFPQTGHVEGVAVLNRVHEVKDEELKEEKVEVKEATMENAA